MGARNSYTDATALPRDVESAVVRTAVNFRLRSLILTQPVVL